MNQPPSQASLLAFVRSAQLGSFAAAAKHLDMSAAAVGQAVARLEVTFGVKLLNRTTRRMSLTADGRILLDRCSDILTQLEELERLFHERRGVIAGPVRVSAPAGFARRHLVPLIARFAQQHRDVEIALDCSDVVRDFVGDPIDVSFRIARPTDLNLIARRIAWLNAITVAAPEYLRRRGTPRVPSDLLQHDCIIYRHPGSGDCAPLRFRQRGREVQLAPRPSLLVNDVDAGCEAAVAGLGIAQPPAYYVTKALEAGTLVPVLSRHTPSPWALYLCYPSAKHLPYRIRAFIEFARRELAEAALG